MKYKLPLSFFTRSAGGALTLNDLDVLGFYVRNENALTKNFDFEVHNVRFVSSTYVPIEQEEELPTEVALAQNYPNPFNPSTSIQFAMPKAGHARLVLYDLMGRVVRVIANDTFAAGVHEVSLNAADLPSGTYIYTLNTGNQVLSKRMTLLK